MLLASLTPRKVSSPDAYAAGNAAPALSAEALDKVVDRIALDGLYSPADHANGEQPSPFAPLIAERCAYLGRDKGATATAAIISVS